MSSRGVCLVIEDDWDIRDLISAILTRSGFEVHAVASGAEGVVAAGNLDPVLVTLDIGLPDMSGHEVARQIRRVSKAPLLFLIGRAGTDDEVASISSGAAAYLTKPFQPQQLQETADQLCPVNRAVCYVSDPKGSEQGRSGEMLWPSAVAEFVE
ncbi:response regulator transcription factor [Arthrobacter glacialis]|uniref:response regulator transcription factor n=1 Tax=Arthrobacter glacialis TaxID=1664 RepID=UPI000CD3F28F|nr:response regulator transcription factor [Arthrobacter glacialis]POH56790.1 two-component response regulator [Arthrobacter glacialis]